MDEFSLINTYFKKQAFSRSEVIFGIGDDAACLRVPEGQELLISTDTLVTNVHFLANWDPGLIAYRAVMVNLSDMAAMAAKPCCISLALTLPHFDERWLSLFSQGLHKALQEFNIALIGGDTTRGPLTITITVHGLAAAGKAVRRSGAKANDKIFVSGFLGAAALAVAYLERGDLDANDKKEIMEKLQLPRPRTDLADILQQYASAAIDISDGLSADLNHICKASGVGAHLALTSLPIHHLVKKYASNKALHFALSGGDDYEICFTIPEKKESKFLECLAKKRLKCYKIGHIVEKKGINIENEKGEMNPLIPIGYSHF